MDWKLVRSQVEAKGEQIGRGGIAGGSSASGVARVQN